MPVPSIVIPNMVALRSTQNTRHRGIVAPFVDRAEGPFELRGTSEVLWSSICNILLTPFNTRIHLLDFGSRLPELVFEPNDDILRNMALVYVRDALAKWEPRVNVIDVSVNRDIYVEGRLHVTVTYSVRGDDNSVARNTITIAAKSGGVAVERV